MLAKYIAGLYCIDLQGALSDSGAQQHFRSTTHSTSLKNGVSFALCRFVVLSITNWHPSLSFVFANDFRDT